MPTYITTLLSFLLLYHTTCAQSTTIDSYVTPQAYSTTTAIADTNTKLLLCNKKIKSAQGKIDGGRMILMLGVIGAALSSSSKVREEFTNDGLPHVAAGTALLGGALMLIGSNQRRKEQERYNTLQLQLIRNIASTRSAPITRTPTPPDPRIAQHRQSISSMQAEIDKLTAHIDSLARLIPKSRPKLPINIVPYKGPDNNPAAHQPTKKATPTPILQSIIQFTAQGAGRTFPSVAQLGPVTSVRIVGKSLFRYRVTVPTADRAKTIQKLAELGFSGAFEVN